MCDRYGMSGVGQLQQTPCKSRVHAPKGNVFQQSDQIVHAFVYGRKNKVSKVGELSQCLLEVGLGDQDGMYLRLGNGFRRVIFPAQQAGGGQFAGAARNQMI